MERVVVDVDLEKFFDRVNHDRRVGRLGKRITDTRVLGLNCRYLEAGIMANGVARETLEARCGCPSDIAVHFMPARSSRSPCMDSNPRVLYPLADVLFHVLP
jgi:hypothetical protein